MSLLMPSAAHDEVLDDGLSTIRQDHRSTAAWQRAASLEVRGLGMNQS